MKKLTVFVMVAILVMMILPACAAPAPTAAPTAAPAPAPAPAPTPTAAAKPIQWHFFEDSGSLKTAMEAVGEIGMADRIEKATNGRLKVSVTADIVKRDDVVAAISEGRIDGGIYSTSPYTQYPWLQINIVPGAWDSVEQMDQVYRQVNWLDEVNKAFKDYNMTNYDFQYLPKHILFSKKPITKLEDFKGLKVRCVGPELISMMQQAGAQALNIVFSEVYLAAQTGVIDALWTAAGPAYVQSLYEVFKYVSDWSFYTRPTSYLVAVNNDSFKSLPADIKPVVEKIIHEASHDSMLAEVQEDKQDYDKWKAKGATINYITDPAEVAKWKPIVTKVMDDWVKASEAKGYRFSPAMAQYLRSRGATVQ